MIILITDDLYTNRMLAGIVINAMGYQYDEAVNGDEAIARLKEKHYDVILMDIEMPVRNGLETTRFIRNNFTGVKKDTFILAVTAHNPEDYFDSYEKHGFNGLISKPITREKLEKYLVMSLSRQAF